MLYSNVQLFKEHWVDNKSDFVEFEKCKRQFIEMLEKELRSSVYLLKNRILNT